MVSTCKKCGDTYTEEIEALGHEEGEGVVTKQPGFLSAGLVEYRCSICSEVLRTDELNSKISDWKESLFKRIKLPTKK